MGACNLTPNWVAAGLLLVWSNFSTALKAAVKPVLSDHLKRDKIKLLMENGSLMTAESIAEFCNTFDLH